MLSDFWAVTWLVSPYRACGSEACFFGSDEDRGDTGTAVVDNLPHVLSDMLFHRRTCFPVLVQESSRMFYLLLPTFTPDVFS